jgi:beta-lactamase regulating signal transducer with metallopeptidase domain
MTASELTSLLLTASIKGSIIVAIALLVGMALRHRMPARWMHVLLLVGVVRLLLPFAPQSPLSMFNLAGGSKPVSPVIVSAPASTVEPAAIRSSISKPAPAEKNPLPAFLAVLWAVGVIFMLGRTVRHTLIATGVARASTPLPFDAEAVRLLDECRAVAGISRPVSLRLTRPDAGPALHGLLRPFLLLPANWQETLSLEQLRFVFLHELAHLRRLDVLWNWIIAVAHALHWFNPLAWIAVSRLAEERELACDALALEHLADSQRREYGGTVLQLLDRWRLHEPVPGVAGMATTRQQMKRRIQMIAAFRNDNRSALWIAAVSILAAVSLTDARAGEQHVKKIVMHGPEMKAVAGKLDQLVSFSVTAGSVEDVMNAIANRTGASITFADGVLDDATRQTRLTLDANGVPAHIALFETLGALDLAARFDETGVKVIRMPEGHEGHVRVMHGEGVHPPHVRIIKREAGEKAQVHVDEDLHSMEGEKVIIRKHAGADDKHEVFIERHPAGASDGTVRKMIDVKATSEDAGNGVTRRKVTVRGGEEGQAEGTLQLEVQRATASAAH